MLSNLTPNQEPVAWGALATALLGLIYIFLPRFGVSLSTDEKTAIGAAAAIVVPLAIGYLVRRSVTPNAPSAPPPTTK